MKPLTISFEIRTKEQLELLENMLLEYSDCGPVHESWSSGELNELKARIEDAIRQAQDKVA